MSVSEPYATRFAEEANGTSGAQFSSVQSSPVQGSDEQTQRRLLAEQSLF